MSEPTPYGAPGARVEDPLDPIDRRFRWKAALIGAGTDLGCSIVAGIVLTVIFSVIAGPQEGATEEMLARMSQSWPFLLFSMAVGGGFTVLGGYVAARMARHSFLKHALAAGAISLVLGTFLFRGDDGPYAGVMALLGYGLHLPLALLGGWLVARAASAKQSFNPVVTHKHD